MIIGLKGIAAYADHAAVLGFEKNEIYDFIMEALASTTVNNTADEMVATMALLDKANTNSYGHPEISEVDIGIRNNPGILISGHDLKDMQELLHRNYKKSTKKYGYFNCRIHEISIKSDFI